mgnify:CR=1 FL=1
MKSKPPFTTPPELRLNTSAQLQSDHITLIRRIVMAQPTAKNHPGRKFTSHETMPLLTSPLAQANGGMGNKFVVLCPLAQSVQIPDCIRACDALHKPFRFDNCSDMRYSFSKSASARLVAGSVYAGYYVGTA